MALRSMDDESEVSALHGRLAVTESRPRDVRPLPSLSVGYTGAGAGAAALELIGVGTAVREVGGQAVEVFYRPEIPIGTVDLVDVDGNVIATVRDVASVRLGTGE